MVASESAAVRQTAVTTATDVWVQIDLQANGTQLVDLSSSSLPLSLLSNAIHKGFIYFIALSSIANVGADEIDN